MFRKAERKRAKLRLAICGVSGSGKTYTSLKIAKGIGGKIAMIDTEHGSGELYSDIEGMPEYDVVQLSAPFSPERYIQIIKEAEKQGYTTLIIDSLSHAWAGNGGVLDIVDKATKASRTNNSFAAWQDATPHQNKLIDTILRSNLHIICTMRSKSAYETVEQNGKKKIIKVGLEPIQRQGVDYEFTVVLDLSVDGHVAGISKDRTGLFDGKHFIADEDTGVKLLEWLNTGEDIYSECDSFINKIKSCGNIENLISIFDEIKKSKIFTDEALREKVIAEKDLKKIELQSINDGGYNNATQTAA